MKIVGFGLGSFVQHGLLKLLYKFQLDRLKIVGLHTFGAKDPKMTLLGPWGDSDWGNEKNVLRNLHTNFEANRSSPFIQKERTLRYVGLTPCFRGHGNPRVLQPYTCSCNVRNKTFKKLF